MNKHSSENGFGAIGAVIVVAVLALVGFVGWYVWHSNKTSDTTADPVSKTQSTKKTVSSSKKETAYFVIKDWNVRAPYDGELTLTVQSVDSQKAVLSSEQLLANPDSDGCIAPKSTNFVIQRYGADEYTTDNRLNEGGVGETAAQGYSDGSAFSGGAKLVKVGDKYYLYQVTKAPCASTVYDALPYFAKTDEAYRLIVPKLEEIK